MTRTEREPKRERDPKLEEERATGRRGDRKEGRTDTPSDVTRAETI